MERSEWKYDAMLLFTVLVWGLNFPVVKAVLEIMHPHVLNVLRFTVSAVTLGALYELRRRRTGTAFLQPLRDHLGQIVGLGLLGFVLYQLCFIVGLDMTTAGNAALIMASAPLWTALVGYFLNLERLGGASWGSLVIVLVGAVVIVLGGSKAVDLGSDTFVGNVVMLLASLFWGSYTALSRPVLRDVSAAGLTFLGLMVGLPFLYGIGLPLFDEVAWDRTTAWTWLAILYSGGLSTGLAVAIWNVAVNRVGASHTAVFGNLTPVVGLVASVVFLGEPVTWAQVTGGVLILGGLLWMRRSRRRETASEPSEATAAGSRPAERTEH